MSEMTSQPIGIIDLPGILYKYRKLIVGSALAGFFLFTFAAFVLPKKFKSHFVVTIYPQYFQSPLINEFVPEFSQPNNDERSQREALIRQTFTPEYMDSLIDQYALSSSLPKKSHSGFGNTLRGLLGRSDQAATESAISARREALRARLEISSLNNTTFVVAYLNSNAETTYGVLKDIHAHLVQNLLNGRLKTLAAIRDAVRKRMEMIPMPRTGGVNVAGTPNTRRDQLRSVQRQIRELGGLYTDEHPAMLQLHERERLLETTLRSEGEPLVAAPLTPVKSAHAESPSSTPTTGNADLYADLNRKLNYLNIALDTDQEHNENFFATLEVPMYPSSPLWPKKTAWALWGLCVGSFAGLFIAGLREYFSRSTLQAPTVASRLSIPLLGELPLLRSKSAAPSPNLPVDRE